MSFSCRHGIAPSFGTHYANFCSGARLTSGRFAGVTPTRNKAPSRSCVTRPFRRASRSGGGGVCGWGGGGWGGGEERGLEHGLHRRREGRSLCDQRRPLNPRT